MNVGDKIGKLELVGKPFHMTTGNRMRLHGMFRCDCGLEKVINIDSVRSKNTRSCGCLLRERLTTHGVATHRLYITWTSMVRRCTNETDKRFESYGGRGISVCSEWHDPRVFVDWGKRNGWKPGLQIDRIDNDGHYEPCNCRFVTPEANANNRRDNVWVDAFGERKTVAQWLRDPRCSVARETLYHRIQRGVSAEEAITNPAN